MASMARPLKRPAGFDAAEGPLKLKLRTESHNSFVEEDSGNVFNGASREEYMQQRVHRKLHSVAATLSDEELAKLGQMKFNSQFPALNAEGAPPVPRADLFGGLDRATFVAQRVHRKLHPMTASLADEELSILGKMKFNDQFSALNAEGGAPPVPRADLFEGLDKQTFLAQRVHRKLQPLAASLSDEELSILGKMKFNDQFSALNAEGGAPAMPRSDLFDGLDRQTFLAQRVHRKLHVRAAALSDEELSVLGKMKFNEQFPALEEHTSSQPSGDHAEDMFEGRGRDAWMREHVHRRLHSQAASLGDDQLLELGKLSFNSQFFLMEALVGPST